MLGRFGCVPLFATLWTVACQALCPRDSPGKNPGVGCQALLQGAFPTQGLNPRLMSPAPAGRFFTTSTAWEAATFLKQIIAQQQLPSPEASLLPPAGQSPKMVVSLTFYSDPVD